MGAEQRARAAGEAIQLLERSATQVRVANAELDSRLAALRDALVRAMETGDGDFVEALVDIGAETRAFIEQAREVAMLLNAWTYGIDAMSTLGEPR